MRPIGDKHGPDLLHPGAQPMPERLRRLLRFMRKQVKRYARKGRSAERLRDLEIQVDYLRSTVLFK